MYGAGAAETPSILLVYFGAQTGMNLYMKNVLSKISVDSEEGRYRPLGELETAFSCGFKASLVLWRCVCRSQRPAHGLPLDLAAAVRSCAHLWLYPPVGSGAPRARVEASSTKNGVRRHENPSKSRKNA